MANKIWSCKIGASENVPDGGDFPMRQAIRKAYLELTGKEPEFLFSGWGAKLTPGEYTCVMEGRKFGDGDYEEEFIPHHQDESVLWDPKDVDEEE